MRYDLFTICDSGYAARALVLYRSLEAASPDFRLRVFCVDEATRALFDRLALEHLTTIPLGTLEQFDAELPTVKPTRTVAEYCWSAKASAALYIFEHEPDVELITYTDADVMFFHDPAPIFEELGTDSILLVPHRNPPQLRWWDDWGVNNAGFLTFRRDDTGLAALRWWRERCLEWCYARLEDGKSGDQTYLDDWPTRFPGTHVLQHVGGGPGPWNLPESEVVERDGVVLVDGSPLIFFHYATLRLYRDRPSLRRTRLLPTAFHVTGPPSRTLWTVDRSYAAIDPEAKRLVWDPYVRRVAEEAQGGLDRLTIPDVFERTAPRALVRWSRRLARALEQAADVGRGKPARSDTG
jgi:hypothetical protein